jgi:hypothetical protein
MNKPKPAWAFLLSAAICGFAFWASPAPAGAHDSSRHTHTAWRSAGEAPEPGPRILSGTVVNADGSAIDDAAVEVFAEDRGPTVDREVLLGRGETNEQGEFAVSGTLRRKVHLNPDSSVPLTVSVTSDGLNRLFILDAVPSRGKGQPWTWGEMPDEKLFASGANIQDLPGEPAGSLVLNMKDATPEPVGTGPETSAAKGGGTLADCKARNWYNFIWVWDGNTQDRLVPIQKIDTLNHSQAKLKWETSTKTRFEVPLRVNGSVVGGGMASSVEDETTAGIRWLARNNFHGVFSLMWRFRHRVEFCVNSEWVDTYREAKSFGVRSGRDKYIPHRWLGGNEPVDRYDMYYCDRGVPPQKIGGYLFISRGIKHRLSGYFSIMGIGLDAEQTNSRDQTEMGYRPDPNSRYAWICGNNADPIHAQLVRETNP